MKRLVFNPVLNSTFDMSEAGFKFCAGGNPTASLVTIPQIYKNRIIRVSLNRETDPIIYRTEFRPVRLPPPHFVLGRSAVIGKRYIYSFFTYLSSSWITDKYPEIIAQFHGVADDESETESGPVIALTIRGDMYFVGVRGSSETQTDNIEVQRSEGFTAVSQDVGKWVSWLFDVRWSYDSGMVIVRKNSAVVATFTGSNCYNDKYGPVFRLGVYKWDWRKQRFDGEVKERMIYYRGIRIYAFD